MSYAIVFSSKTGNTELLADTLHSCLPQADCCYFGNPNPAAMEADTLCGESRCFCLVPLVLAAAKNILTRS